MSTITTINSGDLITNSRADINNNFANLNADKIETSVIDTDTALTANSDAKLPSQKAVKAYVDAGGNVNASSTVKGIVEEATQAEAVSGTAVGATGARLYLNPSIAGTKFPGTQVFSGTSPNATFTDLDLSSVVGAVSRIVLLRVVNESASTLAATFRKNGETGDFGALGSTSVFGASKCVVTSTTGAQYAVVITDSAGVVEWTGNSGLATVKVYVEAYW
jgi:hypothetical protein